MIATFNLTDYYDKVSKGYRGRKVIESVVCWSILDDLEKVGLKGAKRLSSVNAIGAQPRIVDLVAVLKYMAGAECIQSFDGDNVLSVKWNINQPGLRPQ